MRLWSSHQVTIGLRMKRRLLTTFSSALTIVATFPNTGYGYIEFDDSTKSSVKKVIQFTEKPDYATAKSFIESGKYLWNGGIFVWHVNSIIDAFEKFAPEMYSLFSNGLNSYNTDSEPDFIARKYPLAEDISIDYAIMEHAQNVGVFRAE